MYQRRIDRLTEENERLQRDSSTIENSFRDLRLRFEDIKVLSESYRIVCIFLSCFLSFDFKFSLI